MITRRQFVGAAAAASAWIAAPRALSTPVKAPEPSLAEHLATFSGAADGLAANEDFWRPVQRAFNVDRSLIHLNSGGVCPSPASVQQAEIEHQHDEYRRPFYAHEGEIEPQLESIRSALAIQFGCSAEEIALTRNTSEGMEIVQLGVDLKAGDEILTTCHDYPRMLNTWEQRVAREKIRLVKVPVEVPLDHPEALVTALEQAITPRTRLIMCCHMVDLTGQIMPVPEICRMALRHGIPVLVDGAQTFGHFPFRLADLGCDYFATSLHKWLLGPHGTGMLFIRRERIPDLWAMMPADPELKGDIRKFEDVGTQSPAKFLAIGESLSFRSTVGANRIAARLRYLRDYWLDQINPYDRVILRTHIPDACSLTTIDVDGIDPLELRNYLWQVHRIRVRPIRQDNVRGVRISAGLHTTLDELDRFTDVMTDVVLNGLPS